MQKEEKLENITIKRVHLYEIKSAIQKSKVDLLHAHQYRLYHTDIAIKAASNSNMPSVITLHGVYPGSDLLRRIYYYLHNLLLAPRTLKLVKRIIASTEIEATRILQLGAEKHKISFIPNAVDLDEIVQFNPNQIISKELSLKYKIRYPTIMYTGHLAWNKRVEDAIDSMKLVLKEYPKAKLLIVGKDWGRRSYLEKRVREQGITDNVIFTGFVTREELLHLYHLTDIFVMTSFYEAIPTVVLEAMAHKIPVIATNLSGTNLIENEKNGLLYPVGDTEILAKNICKLLNGDFNMQALVKNAYDILVERYTWKVVSKQIQSLYADVLNN
jgi:glycosyltransferase involved in cell wall biosynthesis